MKKIRKFKFLSNQEQKSIFGGTANDDARCCNPTFDCCYPVFGDPVEPATIEACGLIESSCNFWYSNNGCCI